VGVSAPSRFDPALAHIRAAPTDIGTLRLIVRRPAVDARVVAEEGELDTARGLIGDRWAAGNRHRRQRQLTVMGARAAAAVAGSDDPATWAPAGDQLYVDLDLSVDALPPGTRLAIGGAAVIEVSAMPHLGCVKFAARFGDDALAGVNSEPGRALRLRGLNAFVVRGGPVRVGDGVRRV
jgi:MOSC domain-containing protein YiiM